MTDAEIKNVVESDFDETLYENKKAQIVADWRKIEDSFTEGLDLLKGFSQLEYFVTITKLPLLEIGNMGKISYAVNFLIWLLQISIK